MSVNEVVVTHLQAAKAALLQERIKLDAAVADLDRLLRDYTEPNEQPASAENERALQTYTSGGESTPTGTLHLSGPVRLNGSGQLQAGVPSMRDALLTVVQESGPVKAGDVALVLAERYGWQQASVRSLLAKLAASGEVAQLARGLYEDAERARDRHQLQQVDEDTDAEAPVAAGASDSEEPDDGSSWKEGGTANGAEPPRGRDGDSVGADSSHAHGLRASVVEASR